MQWNRILLTKIGRFHLHFPDCNVLLCGTNDVRSVNRFHNDCVIPTERYWSTTYATYCASQEEAIATLCDEKIIGGVISAIDPYSKQETVCSFNIQVI